MRQFFYFTLAYLATAILIMMVFRDEWVNLILGIFEASRSFFYQMQIWSGYVAIAAGVLVYSVGIQAMKSRLKDITYAILICALFLPSFNLIKTTMPYMVPFYADPFLAQFDKWLHFGQDPWKIVSPAAPYFMYRPVISSYITLWSIPALFFPIILAAADSDAARVRRFILLYVVAWAVIGNVFALAFMSVGPVYYDRLLGGDRFEDLTYALQHSAATKAVFVNAQSHLWKIYVESSQSIISGISAFPSVHIATVLVAALYMIERSLWLVLPAFAFVVMVFFVSIFSGYHYAVDGYFSLLVIVGLWAWQRRHSKRNPLP